jgi:class 3 adenylate cyclase/tetratricopeptide (TPR) repeat protein
MICPKCRAGNREDAQFCGQCGGKLEAPCPACGRNNPPDSRFCDGCGQSLSAPRPEPVLSTEAERKHVTVLFSDLSGYTAMSEKLDPEEVKEITTRIFGEVAQIVSRYDGFVEKYIGDAVVALFGVPKAHEDDHVRAIRAAKDIHESVDSAGRQYEAKIGRRLAFHSGITTGLVVTGEVNLDKGTHGVAGDTINLASRLCSLAKTGEILVDEGTYLLGNSVFSFDKLSPVMVKGKAEPIAPYRLLEEEEQPSKGLATQSLTSPLVGRNAEVAAIKGCVNRLLDGQGGILSVIGDAGLGKSRLMAELRSHYTNQVLWLEGKTLSYGQKMSYWPFREILWQYTGITEDDTDASAWEKYERKIIDLFPTDSGEVLLYLASLIGLNVKGGLAENPEHLDGEFMKTRIYLTSRRFFERLAEEPLVLVFEDLHWADESTVALIQHLFPLINRVPLLICGVSRPEVGVPAARLRDAALEEYERRYTEILLNALSSTECTNLMDNLLPIENLPSRVRQLILAKADGNPFFVEEIMRTLVDKRAVHYENGWKVTSGIEAITIPDTIQGVITARIDRLDEEVKQVLKTASVIGRTFFYRVLRSIEDAIKDLDGDLDTLTSTELIREKQKAPEVEYIFKHALVQESTYESILLRRRHELHGKVAAAIEQLFSDRIDEFSSILAYHYAKAEQWEKAQEYLFKAGDQAGRIAADAEALTHYQQALETYTKAFGDDWDPIQRGALDRKMGEAFYRRGEWDQAIEYLQSALVHFGRPRLPVAPLMVKLHILKQIGVLIAYLLFRPDSMNTSSWSEPDVVQEVVRTYDILEDIHVLQSPVPLLSAIITCLNYSFRTKYPPGVAEQYATFGLAVHSLSLRRIARFFLERSLALSEKIQHPVALTMAHQVSAMVSCDIGQPHRAVDHSHKAAEVSRKVGYSALHLWANAIGYAQWAHNRLGEFDEADRLIDELIRVGEEGNDRYVHSLGLICSLHNADKRGDLERSIAVGKKVIEIFEKVPAHEFRAIAGYHLSKFYLRLGDAERSLQVLTETDEYRIKHRVMMYSYMVSSGFPEIYLALAEGAAGAQRKDFLRKAQRALKKSLPAAKVRRSILPEITRFRGTYDWLIGRPNSARSYWDRSLAEAGKMGMRYELAMTHLEIGKRLNDLDHLKKAEAIFADIGAEFDLAETRRLLEAVARHSAA